MLLPVLLALDAELVLATATLSIEDHSACPCDRLLTEIIIKDPYRTCATRKISRSQAGFNRRDGSRCNNRPRRNANCAGWRRQ